VLRAALTAAKAAEGLKPRIRTLTIAESIATTHRDLVSRVALTSDCIAENCFPNTPETIVPLAISLALVTQSVERAVLLAANVGGDSDSVASIAGAIAGALRPETVNEDWFKVVSTVNDDSIVDVASSLSAVRTAGRISSPG
jgi:ADP-ribosylglycohydrolase